MLKHILKQMETRSGAGLSLNGDGRSLWFNEWSRLFLKAFEPDVKVVYSSLYAFPGELLAAFDIVPFDFELASGLLGVAGMQTPALEAAEAAGYGADVCSFHRAALGAFSKKFFPEPDIFVTTSFFCDSKVKTNEALAISSGKPSYLVNVPQEINRDSVKYVEKQLRESATAIALASGKEFDEDRLKEAVRSSNRSRNIQLELLELLKKSPAPWEGRELISYSINSLVFSGTEVKERLDAAFLKEAKERIASGALELEKHRIYWLAWLPAYKNNLFEILSARKTAVPYCETFKVHWDELDEDKPFEALALKCLRNPFIGPTSRRIENLGRILVEYRIDGAILFATPACKHSKTAARLLHDSFAEMDIPFLTLDMDICDPRDSSPERLRKRIESFLDILDSR